MGHSRRRLLFLAHILWGDFLDVFRCGSHRFGAEADAHQRAVAGL